MKLSLSFFFPTISYKWTRGRKKKRNLNVVPFMHVIELLEYLLWQRLDGWDRNSNFGHFSTYIER